MKKRVIIWIVLTIILLGSVGLLFAFKDSSDQSYISNADEIKKQWETKQVNQSTIKEFSGSVKDSDIISEIKFNQFEKGYNVQVIMTRTLSNNETIELAQELLNLLFQSKNIDFASLSLYPKSNDKAFIQIRADKTTYLANENEFLTGIDRMTIMNEEE